MHYKLSAHLARLDIDHAQSHQIWSGPLVGRSLARIGRKCPVTGVGAASRGESLSYTLE